MSGFQIAAGKSGEIAHDDRPYFPGSHQLYQAIHPGAVHRCPAIAVIYNFRKMLNRKPLATQILLDTCALRLNTAAFIYTTVFSIAVFF